MRPDMFQTEVEFVLPCGYADSDGTLHREGVMRRATAADEITPQGDSRVIKNPAYLIVILLSRVITKLGDIAQINPNTVENLFSADLAFLQEFYERINATGSANRRATCPKCAAEFEIEAAPLGE